MVLSSLVLNQPNLIPSMVTTSLCPLVDLNTAPSLLIKLNSSSYPTWYKQVHILLATNNLLGYADGTASCPSAKLTSSADNPNYLY